MPKLSQERLKQLLSYDVNTGIFTWLVDRGSNKVKGQAAGSDKDGYINISIDGRLYRAHLLAWLYVHGYMPNELDHFNREKSNNRISNLRLTTRGTNSQNRGVASNNKTGVSGVSLHKPSGKFVAQITVDKNVYYLGLHSSLEAATAARKQAEIKFNFGAKHA